MGLMYYHHHHQGTGVHSRQSLTIPIPMYTGLALAMWDISAVLLLFTLLILIPVIVMASPITI